jgi:hypothetical protein
LTLFSWTPAAIVYVLFVSFEHASASALGNVGEEAAPMRPDVSTVLQLAHGVEEI